jgi:hypothetical protein
MITIIVLSKSEIYKSFNTVNRQEKNKRPLAELSNAALSLFSEKGNEETSVTEIAGSKKIDNRAGGGDYPPSTHSSHYTALSAFNTSRC